MNHISPTMTRDHGQLVHLPNGPPLPVHNGPAFLLAIQFLLAVDYLRDGRRVHLMAYVNGLERSIVKHLIATHGNPTTQTSEDPEPS